MYKTNTSMLNPYFSICYMRNRIHTGSRPEVFSRKTPLKIYSKRTGKHACWIVISIKMQSNFIEITLWYGCFPVSLMHIFRTPFPRNTSAGLLLYLGSVFSTFCQAFMIVFCEKSACRTPTWVLLYFNLYYLHVLTSLNSGVLALITPVKPQLMKLQFLFLIPFWSAFNGLFLSKISLVF